MFRHHQFQQIRHFGFKRRTVTSPRGIKLLKWSRRFLIGVGALYGAGITVTAGIYFYTTHTLGKIQPIPSDWTFRQRLLGLAGANHHEEQRHAIVVRYYEQLINQLIFPDGKDKMVDINDQKPSWLAGYADIAIRLGLSQEEMGNRVDAKEALTSGLSIPYGQKTLKNRAAMQLGRIELEDGRDAEAETLFKEALGYVAESTADGQLVFNTPICEEQINASTELAKMHVKRKNYKEALTLFLTLYKELDQNAFKSKLDLCYKETTMSYISEVLWALGNKRDALIWSEGSFHDASPKSRRSVECGLCAKMSAQNTATMYKSMRMVEEQERFDELAANTTVILANPNRFESIWSGLL